MIRCYLLIILLLLNYSMKAQKITLNGNVFSFKGEKVMLLKKAQKNVSFDGSLENATINVSGENTSTTITTGLSGSFSIPLENPGKYTIKINKNNYSTIEIDVNYADAGKRSRFESIFLILKQEDNSSAHMGAIEINGGQLNFIPDNSGSDKSKNDLFLSNAHLLEKAALINKSGGGSYTTNTPTKINHEIANTNPVINSDTIITKKPTSYEGKLLLLLAEAGETNMDSLKLKLADAKKLLETLSPESAEYKNLQQQIAAAEQKIKDKEAIIAYQNNEISLANKIILYISLFAGFALLSAALLFYFFKQKKKYANLLKEKNANIVRINTKLLSSIRYASLIQTSFLQDKQKLKKLFSDSFVFNKPKDILSGDFYWFAHKNNHRVVVVADCTGHGVPGAMLTVLGHNVLEDVINVQGEVVPSKILIALNKAIQTTFANNNHYLEYGMDITVVSIKDHTNEILLSGVNNGIYRLRDGQKQYFPVSPKTLGGDITEQDLADQKIDIQKGDNIFLFSDGYLDQFSADEKKVVKFNISRFEKLLTEIGSKQNFNDSEITLEKTLKDWMGEREQIDDICIMGIRI